MASNSVDFLSYKPVTPASSTNHKEDIIKARLHELKIVYKIMLNCEHCRNELIKTVKSDGKSDSTTYQKNQIGPQGQHY